MNTCKECGTRIPDKHRNGRGCRFCPTCLKTHRRTAAKIKRDVGMASGMLFGRPLNEVIFERYRKSAEKRGYPFSLTFEDFTALWGKPCIYCGESIETIGIDRINNEFGYVAGNIAPCCTRCNLTKRGMLPEDFIAMCVKVARRWMAGLIELNK